jgi:hypothetical protein
MHGDWGLHKSVEKQRNSRPRMTLLCSCLCECYRIRKHAHNIARQRDRHQVEIWVLGLSESTKSLHCSAGRHSQNVCWKHTNFSRLRFYFESKVELGENVREERDCPFQYLLASNDHCFCCHLTLAVWLEVYLTEKPTPGELTTYVFTFSDNISVPGGANQLNIYILAQNCCSIVVLYAMC